MRFFIVILYFFLSLSGRGFCDVEGPPEKGLKKAGDFRMKIPAKIVRKIEIPRGYPEGLLIQDDLIWVNNGEGGDTWIVDMSSGELISTVKPAGTFSEGISKAPQGGYFISDWDAKKLFKVRIEGDVMIREKEVSLAPARPAGVCWNGSHLYVITWTRGVGTKYHLLKMDRDFNIIDTIRIREISEPSQLAWDGKYLWISSWYDGHIYKIDIGNWRIKGYFRMEFRRATGIAWDGDSFWLTGTDEDLYRVKLSPLRK